MVFLLGGRAAEAVVLGEISTGARSDLERATKLVRKMITEYGMSDKLGPMSFGHGPAEQVFLGRDISRDRDYSEEVAASIDQEMKRIITDAYNRAEEIIRTYREQLDAIVEALLEKETLEAADFERLMASGEQGSGEEKPETPQEVEA